MGVSIIVDMRGSKSSHEQIAVEELGMQYIAIPWHCPFPSDAMFAGFLRLIHDNPKRNFLCTAVSATIAPAWPLPPTAWPTRAGPPKTL